MTTSAILTERGRGQTDHGKAVRWSLVTFMIGLLGAMLCAVFSSFRRFAPGSLRARLPTRFLWATSGSMRRADYIAAMADLMRSDADV